MITAFFAKWGAKLLAALAVIGTALGALRMYGRSKRSQGASEEREKQHKEAEKVRDKIDKVPEPSSGDTSDRLRKRHDF